MLMTMEEYQAAKARLIATYGGTARNAMHKRAQALARLYADSGWTSRALAEIEQLSHTYIVNQTRFGRFLLYAETNGFHKLDCNERQEREAWKRTDTNATEEARFAAVAEILAEGKTTSKAGPSRQLGKQLVAQFSDSKWHRVEEIAEVLEADRHTVKDMLDRIVLHGLFKTYAEKRPAGKSLGSYRLVKGGKRKLDLTAFLAEAKPVLDEMDGLINGHPVHFSQQLMKVTFAQFRNVIERICR